jgi:hypothetical protein
VVLSAVPRPVNDLNEALAHALHVLEEREVEELAE